MIGMIFDYVIVDLGSLRPSFRARLNVNSSHSYSLSGFDAQDNTKRTFVMCALVVGGSRAA
jgi:hypothetical protein